MRGREVLGDWREREGGREGGMMEGFNANKW